MPETNPSDDIIDLTDFVEEDESPASPPGSGGADVDMSFERELEDLFSDAGPAPSAASAPAPPSSAAADDPLEMEEMDLSGLGLDDASPAAPASKGLAADDEDAIDLSDLVDDLGDSAPPQTEEVLSAAIMSDDAHGALDNAGDSDDLDNFSDIGAAAATPGAPSATAADTTDDDALPDLSGLGLDEPEQAPGLAAAFPAEADLSAATDMAAAGLAAGAAAAATAAPAPPPPPPPADADIDLEALDAIIAKAGGPPPAPSEEETQAAAEALEAAAARLAAVEDRISALETAVSGVHDATDRHDAALAALADKTPPQADVAPALAAQAGELKAFIEERLEAFGQDMADKIPPQADVAPALDAQAGELKAFVEERIEAFGQDVSARLAALPDPSAETAGLRDEMATLRDEISTLRDALAAKNDEAAAAMNEVSALRQEMAGLTEALAALRGDVSCRVTKVDQDALATRIRMDLGAEIAAGIEKAVPAAAARIIREEIAALASEMDE